MTDVLRSTTGHWELLAGNTIAMVTCYVRKMIRPCLTMIGQCFDTIIVASTDKERLCHNIKILENSGNHFKPPLNLTTRPTQRPLP